MSYVSLSVPSQITQHPDKACAIYKGESTLPMIPEQVKHPNSDIFRCSDCREGRIWDQKIPNEPILERNFLIKHPPVIHRNYPQSSDPCLCTDNEYLLLDKTLEERRYKYWKNNLRGQLEQGVPTLSKNELKKEKEIEGTDVNLSKIPPLQRKWIWSTPRNIGAENQLYRLHYYNPLECLTPSQENHLRKINVPCLQAGPSGIQHKAQLLPVDKVRENEPRHPVPVSSHMNDGKCHRPQRLHCPIEGGCRLSQSDTPLYFGCGTYCKKDRLSTCRKETKKQIRQGYVPWNPHIGWYPTDSTQYHSTTPCLWNRSTSVKHSLPTTYENELPNSSIYWNYVEDCSPCQF